jgi:hypothetical protein
VRLTFSGRKQCQRHHNSSPQNSGKPLHAILPCALHRAMRQER